LKRWIPLPYQEQSRGEERGHGTGTCASILHRRYSTVSINLALCNPFAKYNEVLKATVTEDGVYRIRRRERALSIEVSKIEEAGHGDILSDEFINWRIKLELAEKESLNEPNITKSPDPSTAESKQ